MFLLILLQHDDEQKNIAQQSLESNIETFLAVSKESTITIHCTT